MKGDSLFFSFFSEIQLIYFEVMCKLYSFTIRFNNSRLVTTMMMRPKCFVTIMTFGFELKFGLNGFIFGFHSFASASFPHCTFLCKTGRFFFYFIKWWIKAVFIVHDWSICGYNKWLRLHFKDQFITTLE